MTDPLLTLLVPMETLVSDSPSPIIHYTITLDLTTSIIFSLTIVIFFLFLFHLLNAFLQWFLDVRPDRDLELGSDSSFYESLAQNNLWILRLLESLVSNFEERRLRKLRALEKLPPALKFGTDKTMLSPSSSDCAICLEEFLKGESCQVLPDCNHIFHLNCIDVWLRKKLTCPVCRNCILD